MEVRSEESRLTLRADPVEEEGNGGGRILRKGILAAVQTPVVEKRSFSYGVQPHDLGGGLGARDLAPLLPKLYQLSEQSIVHAALVEQLLFAALVELLTVQAGKQLDVDGVLDHHEQLAGEEGHVIEGVLLKVQFLFELGVLFVEEIGEGADQAVFTVKVVVEGAL